MLDYILVFVSGAAVGAIVLSFFQGLASKAGESTWTWIVERFKPKPIEPAELPQGFVIQMKAPGNSVWVQKSKEAQYLAEGYVHYPHPTTGGECYRISGAGPGGVPRKEFLMVEKHVLKGIQE